MNKFLASALSVTLWWGNTLNRLTSLLVRVACFVVAVFGAGAARMAASASQFCGDDSAEKVAADILGYADDEDNKPISARPDNRLQLFYVQDNLNNRHVIVTARDWSEARQLAERCDPASNWSQSSCASIGDSDLECGVFRYLIRTTGAETPRHDMTDNEAGQLSD